jgi:hypothetical protein
MKYLYILCRNDMASLGRGKGHAQSAHAANAFTWDTIIRPSIENTSLNADALEWSRQADGFGTTIALTANLLQIEEKVRLAKALGFAARIVPDPEYPLFDGRTLHLIPDVITGAYIFGEKEDLKIILRDLDLVPNDPI